jgi:hypothetical protein
MEDTGSRWAGQALTIDSLAARGSPDRVIRNKYVHSRVSPHAYYPDEENGSLGEPEL